MTFFHYPLTTLFALLIAAPVVAQWRQAPTSEFVVTDSTLLRLSNKAIDISTDWGQTWHSRPTNMIDRYNEEPRVTEVIAALDTNAFAFTGTLLNYVGQQVAVVSSTSDGGQFYQDDYDILTDLELQKLAETFDHVILLTLPQLPPRFTKVVAYDIIHHSATVVLDTTLRFTHVISCALGQDGSALAVVDSCPDRYHVYGPYLISRVAGGGAKWTDITSHFSGDPRAVKILPPLGWYVQTGSGVYRSRDRGTSWLLDSARVLPTLFVGSTGTAYSVDNSADYIMRSDDTGRTWYAESTGSFGYTEARQPRPGLVIIHTDHSVTSYNSDHAADVKPVVSATRRLLPQRLLYVGDSAEDSILVTNVSSVNADVDSVVSKYHVADVSPSSFSLEPHAQIMLHFKYNTSAPHHFPADTLRFAGLNSADPGIIAQVEVAKRASVFSSEREALLLWQPNPFDPEREVTQVRLPAESVSSATIFDALGRIVAQIPSDGAVLSWDGRDRTGRTLSTGMYFARLTVIGMPSVCSLHIRR